MRGWNLQVKVFNLRFSLEKINQDSNPKKGQFIFVLTEKTEVTLCLVVV